MSSSFPLQTRCIWWLILLLPPALLVLALLVGSQDWQWLLHDELGQTVLWQLRLPRALMALVVGAALAFAGVLVQGLVRNPLADPSLLGVSGGAAVGVAVALFLVGLGWQLPSVSLPVAAVIGALISLVLVLKIASTGSAIQSMSYLILAGIAMGMLTGALVGLFSYLASDSGLRQLSFWSMGSLASASWLWLGIVASLLLGATLFWWPKLSSLDALLLGEMQARALGVQVMRLQWQVVLWTALLVGVAVAACGMIGFIGLVCPHLARLLTGGAHRRVLPLAALLGGLLLLSADILARSLIAPAEIPIGILTALVGGPVFIGLLLRERRHWL